MDTFLTAIENASPIQIAIFGVLFFAIWFLPAILAVFFNRKHFKLIAIACVPAGLSFIAWGGLMIWAVTGKVVDKYRKADNSQAA